MKLFVKILIAIALLNIILSNFICDDDFNNNFQNYVTELTTTRRSTPVNFPAAGSEDPRTGPALPRIMAETESSEYIIKKAIAALKNLKWKKCINFA